MKKRINIILISTVLLIIIFTACDELVSPTKARSNPYDQGNPIPAAANFTATLQGTYGSREVELSWDEGSSDAEDTNMDGFLIVYKTGSAPLTIWDGEVHGKFAAEGSGITDWDDDIDALDSYPRGYRVYYSIFTYGAKDPESDYPSFEVDEDGTVRNAEYYDFTGPVSDSVDVMAYLDLPVSDDRYMSQADNNNWINNYILDIVTDNNTNRTLACILFDLTSFPDGATISGADLTLTKSDFSSSSAETVNMQISRWEDDWRNNDDFTTLDGMTAFNLVDVEVPYDSGAQIIIDIADTFSGWIDGSYSNYGFKLRSLDSPAVQVSMPFAASEEDGKGPRLRVYFMNE